jgi:hypothetical protein
LRHCATSRKVAGSIPDCVIGIFHSHNPSGRTMALGLTQPLTEMSTRNVSCYHFHVPIVLKSGILNHLENSGPVQGCNGISLPFIRVLHIKSHTIKPFVKLHVTQRPLVPIQKSLLSSISLPLGRPDSCETRQCILLSCMYSAPLYRQ